MQCCAGLSPQQVLQSNMDRWMMISNSLVSLDGTVVQHGWHQLPSVQIPDGPLCGHAPLDTSQCCYATCEQTSELHNDSCMRVTHTCGMMMRL